MRGVEVILTERPVGVPRPRHFALRETEVVAPGPDEALARLTHWSVDPAMRGWTNAAANYAPPVPLGAPMRAFAVGDVIASNRRDLAEGDVVEGLLGWRTHAVIDGAASWRKVLETDLPRSYALGVLGLNGTTAYFGLLEGCSAQPGETVVVSTAAGAVGSVAGQIAKIRGCRAVGVAGGPEKTRLCLEAFGFDAAIDYKTEDVAAALANACPDGVDCYFDNTCDPISDAVMTRLARGARVLVCGTAAVTDWDPPPLGPRVHRQLLTARARMQGFLIFDYQDRLQEARTALAGWLRAGALTVREHVLEGAEHAPGAIEMLYRGENAGKLIIAV